MESLSCDEEMDGIFIKTEYFPSPSGDSISFKNSRERYFVLKVYPGGFLSAKYSPAGTL